VGPHHFLLLFGSTTAFQLITKHPPAVNVEEIIMLPNNTKVQHDFFCCLGHKQPGTTLIYFAAAELTFSMDSFQQISLLSSGTNLTTVLVIEGNVIVVVVHHRPQPFP
jgi:hypothetical protein